MIASGSNESTGLLREVGRTLGADPLVRLYCGALALYAAASIYAGGLPAVVRDLAAVFFVALTFIALQASLPQIRAPEDRAFWNDLSRATICWLAVPVLNLVFPKDPRPLWADWVGDVLYALFYVGLYLALAVRPHHRHRWRPVALERRLTWTTVTVAVLGLALYFLIPVFVDQAYDSRSSATGLFLILDGYFSLRLLQLVYSVPSVRWRLLYGCLAAGTLAILVNDVFGGLRLAEFLGWSWQGISHVTWKLPPLAFLLGARARHHPFPMELPTAILGGRSEATFPGPLGQTMIFALVFPLVHFTGYQAELMSLKSKDPRAAVVFAWLFLLTLVAIYQHRRLAFTTADLRAERGRTERALRRIEDDLRLRKQLQSVVAERNAANEIFSQAFQASPDVLAILRLNDGFLTDINASSKEIFGYRPQDLVGRSVRDLHLWVRPRDRETLERLLREKRSLKEYQAAYRKKSGELGLALVSAERIELEGVPHVFLVVHDITENRHRDSGLERRSVLLAKACCAVCTIDLRGRISYWNEAARELFGLAPDEVRGELAEALPGCGELLAAVPAGPVRAVVTRHDGVRIAVSSHAYAIDDPGGRSYLVMASGEAAPPAGPEERPAEEGA